MIKHSLKLLRIKKNILATLAYFNMFDYPLKRREIFIFLSHAGELHELDRALIMLTDECAIFKIGEFYSLHNNYALAERRLQGNKKAAEMLKQAHKAARLISSFPFVKGVAVSGSLSKNFADEKADIDFFIITSANRLWIARSFLHIFKKLTFIFKMQHFFCMNYFIDETACCIREKNIYTATEVATLMPVYGIHIFEDFYAANNWTKNFLPNNYMHIAPSKEVRKTLLKTFAEFLLNNRPGNILDNLLMKATVRSWNKKTMARQKDDKGMVLSMHAGKHFAKPDPSNFQRKILQRYRHAINELQENYDLSYRLKNELL